MGTCDVVRARPGPRQRLNPFPGTCIKVVAKPLVAAMHSADLKAALVLLYQFNMQNWSLRSIGSFQA
jgi:hypothetical protein